MASELEGTPEESIIPITHNDITETDRRLQEATYYELMDFFEKYNHRISVLERGSLRGLSFSKIGFKRNEDLRTELNARLSGLTNGLNPGNPVELETINVLGYNLYKVFNAEIKPNHKLIFPNQSTAIEWAGLLKDLLTPLEFEDNKLSNQEVKNLFLGYETESTKSVILSLQGNPDISQRLVKLFGRDGLNWYDLDQLS